jgi:SAM-dependent methyltransferase
MVVTGTYQPENAFTPLVCPFDLGGFTRPESGVLRCASGHIFPVVRGTPDLAVEEDWTASLHHRPDRKLVSFPSYDEQRHIGQPVIPRPTPLTRIRALQRLKRSVRFYRQTVPLAFARLEVDAPDRSPAPPADRFTDIFGPGLYAHELLKRLEKELFWDRLSLTRPACEIGTCDGNASRYFFTDREIDFGSEYLLDQLVRSQIPHGMRFSANIKFLPFADASLETILCSQTVTCVYASIWSMLAEVNRVLRPGGRFLFTTHGPAYMRSLPVQGWPEMGLSARDCMEKNEQRANYMAHLYTREEWRQILSATGFDLTESRGILSLDLARYSQLFYFTESFGPNVFRERYQRGRVGGVVQVLFGGGRAYRDCQAKYRDIMQRILAHELARHANAEFDDQHYLDAGIVATKRLAASPPIARLTPRPPSDHR